MPVNDPPVNDPSVHEHSGPGYASPQDAREQPPEQFVYVAALYEGTGAETVAIPRRPVC